MKYILMPVRCFLELLSITFVLMVRFRYLCWGAAVFLSPLLPTVIMDIDNNRSILIVFFILIFLPIAGKVCLDLCSNLISLLSGNK